MAPLLDIRNLSAGFRGRRGCVNALRDVIAFPVRKGAES